MSRLALLPDRVFDSLNGQMLEGHAVIVDDDRVEAVVPAGDVPDPTPLPGTTIVPGLIDVHTHLIGPVDNGQGYAALVMRSSAQEALIGVKHAAETVGADHATSALFALSPMSRSGRRSTAGGSSAHA